MARPLRLDAEGAVHHVLVRGNERRAIFRDDADRQLYLARLVHYRDRYGFRLFAYCLMGNHAHLAMETGRVPLSRLMHGLQSSYTQAFNRRQGAPVARSVATELAGPGSGGVRRSVAGGDCGGANGPLLPSGGIVAGARRAGDRGRGAPERETAGERRRDRKTAKDEIIHEMGYPVDSGYPNG